MIRICWFVLGLFALFPGASAAQRVPQLRVSADGHRFETASGQPFFWLGDTGWLLFQKTTREEATRYLDLRQEQGFNVIQAMLLHDPGVANHYGRKALIGNDISKQVPDADSDSYWSHVEFVVREAAKRRMYLALVPVWGAEVRGGKITEQPAQAYARFLAKRFAGYPNIIWLNGGDVRGGEGREVWETIGRALRALDTMHLIGFHPRGRHSSSEWFHDAPWLDFNMFQSGHRTYAQDTSRGDAHYGEDNWRYVKHDYALRPPKPVLDGEPSYENIPYGLHDSTAPRWSAPEVRRYAWWSVLSGAAGFTYGENAVMQFHTAGDTAGAYGVGDVWTNTIHTAGANQMRHLKKTLLSVPAFCLKPAPGLLAGDSGVRYDYIPAMASASCALVYTYTGRNFRIRREALRFPVRTAHWISPSTGEKMKASYRSTSGSLRFDPPGDPKPGNDWALELRP